MFKKKREYVNQLTELIKNNPNIDVETVFTHEQLSITIRNEAKIFLDYIFPEKEIESDDPILPNYDKIIDYALSNKTHEFIEDKSDFPNLNIVNQNAASFLSSPSKRLNELVNNDKKKRLFKKLRYFICSECKANSLAVGNFSRIFAMWITKNPEEFEINNIHKHYFYVDNFTIDDLIKFCVKNVQELAYAELLERFLTTEYDSESVNEIRTKVLYEILQRVRDFIGDIVKVDKLDNNAISMTFFQHDQQNNNYKTESAKKQLKDINNSKQDPIANLSQSVPVKKKRKIKPHISHIQNDENPTNDNQTENIKDENIQQQTNIFQIKMQPLTYELNTIPIPKHITEIPKQYPNALKGTTCVKTSQLIPISKEIRYEDGNKLLAYTLINTIWSSGCETPAIFELIQKQKQNDNQKKILEYLLFIGVFGYSNVMVSSTAFRILNIIINGDPKFEIPPIPKEDRKSKLDNDIIDFYADFVVFDIENLSNLAVFSFPIFYNHVYKELKAEKDSIVVYGLKNIESRYLGPDKKYGKTLKHTTNKKGLTPFVYLTPIVLTEPPLSTELTASYFKILNSIFTERNELLGKLKIELEDEKELERIVERVKDIDEFYLNFISYRFEYPGLEGRFNIFELVEKLFPLNQRVYTTDEDKPNTLYDEEQILKIHELSKGSFSRPLFNNSIVRVAKVLLRNLFLISMDAPLISKHSPTQMPYFVLKRKITEKDIDEINQIKEIETKNRIIEKKNKEIFERSRRLSQSRKRKIEEEDEEEEAKVSDPDDDTNETEENHEEVVVRPEEISPQAEDEMYLIELLLTQYEFIKIKSEFNKNATGPRKPQDPNGL